MSEEVAEGGLLGGRVRYRQPLRGFRTGIESVLLAASVPAKAGEAVLEAGTGAGAALLCLAARVPDLKGIGVERDPELAALARANLAANGIQGITIETGDILAFRPPLPFAHALANPPWHYAGTAPEDKRKAAAKRAEPGLIADWIPVLAQALKTRGTLTLILPAAALSAALAEFAATGIGAPVVAPLWPRAGQAARLILTSGRKGARGGLRLLAGLTLHDRSGFSPEAEAILRHGAALPLI